ncbi:MAG: DUF2092 domain-containing protein [Candidatus Sulfotelmatobacter sp.]
MRKTFLQEYSQAEQQPVHCRSSRPLLFSFIVSFLLIGLACGCGSSKPTTAITNDPDQLLRQMSDKLAQAKKLSFKVDRKLDAALVEGRNIPESAQITISVSRPGKFLAKADSQDNVRQFVFDGQNLSVYDATMNLYATVPEPGTIDEVVAKINEKYGFTPPLAEFMLSDPYGALKPRIKSQAYKGRETVGGVECHHLSLGGDVADSELWIGVADLLPRKLVATFKNREGGPQLQADFSDWNLAATLDDNFFTFVPPKDAESVEMVTEAQMQETAAKMAAKHK